MNSGPIPKKYNFTINNKEILCFLKKKLQKYWLLYNYYNIKHIEHIIFLEINLF